MHVRIIAKSIEQNSRHAFPKAPANFLPLSHYKGDYCSFKGCYIRKSYSANNHVQSGDNHFQGFKATLQRWEKAKYTAQYKHDQFQEGVYCKPPGGINTDMDITEKRAKCHLRQ